MPSTLSKKIGALSFCLALSACSTKNETPTQERSQLMATECRKQIHRSLLSQIESKPAISKISEAEFRQAEMPENRKVSYEKEVLKLYGGHLFDMKRMPGMAENCPSVMQSPRAAVYMSFPETSTESPKAIIFMHGLGGWHLRARSIQTVIKATREMQEGGEPLVLIAPQNSWNSYVTQRQGPGNWHDLSDPDTLLNLIRFAEGVINKSINDITLSSFSAGNIGVVNILQAFENAKDGNPEKNSLYHKIQKITFFDSATGSGSEQLAKWMADNPLVSISNYFNDGISTYREGNQALLGTPGIAPERITEVHMRGDHRIDPDYWKQAMQQ